jgi:hypothetical protein
VEAVDDGLAVRVSLSNRGDTGAAGVLVQGELLGERDEGRLDSGIAAGGTGTVALRFPVEVRRPGVHPVALRLEYQATPSPGVISQRAYLLLSLGANPPPAVRVAAPALRLRDRDPLRVTVESADGASHRVRLRVLTPKGLNAESPEGDVVVPAQGAVTVDVPILRGSVARPSQQGLLIVAGSTDGPEETTAVATTVVHVAGDPAWLPRVRRPLAAAAFLLLVAAVTVEVVRALRPAAPPA